MAAVYLARGARILTLAPIVALALSQCIRSTAAPDCAVRFTIPPPPAAQFSPRQIPAVSPDGSRVAFTAVGADRITRLWVHSLSRSVVRLLPGTTDASFPFWSSDGERLGYFADGLLKRIDLRSDTPTVLADAPEGRGGSWSAQGSIIFSAASGPSPAQAIFSVPSAGGPVRRLTNIANDQPGDFWPAFLPDSEHFMYASVQQSKRLMFLGSIRSREKIYVFDGSSPLSTGPGFVLFADDHALLRVPFHDKALFAQRARDLVTQAVARGPSGMASFSASADGTVVVYGRAGSEIVWLTAQGEETAAIPDPGSYRQPSLSPSGDEILVSVGGPSLTSYYVYATKSDRWRRVTGAMGSARRPLWAADGAEIIFTAIDSTTTQIRAARADGSGVVKSLFHAGQGAYAAAISPQGGLMAIVEPPTTIRATVNLRVVSGSGPVGLDAATVWQKDSAWKQYAPAFSPDGLRLAYVSEQSGRAEVYVTDLVPQSVPWRVSQQGGSGPLWSGDGRQLLYRNGAGIVAVSTDGSPSTWGGRERVILREEILRAGLYAVDDFDLTRDGARFLMLKSPDPRQPAPLMGLAGCRAVMPRVFP